MPFFDFVRNDPIDYPGVQSQGLWEKDPVRGYEKKDPVRTPDDRETPRDPKFSF